MIEETGLKSTLLDRTSPIPNIVERIQETPSPVKNKDLCVRLHHAFRCLISKEDTMENLPTPSINSPYKSSSVRALFTEKNSVRVALSTLQACGSQPLLSKLNSGNQLWSQSKLALANKKRKQRSSPSMNKRKKFGEINAGVGHGIRKAKIKRKVKTVHIPVPVRHSSVYVHPKKPQNQLFGQPLKYLPFSSNSKSEDKRKLKNLDQLNGDSRNKRFKSDEKFETPQKPHTNLWEEEEDNDLDEIHTKVHSIVTELDNSPVINSLNLISDLTLQIPYVSESQIEKLDKIDAIIEVVKQHSCSDSEFTCDVDASSNLHPDKIKEVENLINMLMGDESMEDCIDQTTSSSTLTLELTKKETPTTELTCTGLDVSTELELQKMRDNDELEELEEKLNNSSYVDPDDSDPFAEYDMEICETEKKYSSCGDIQGNEVHSPSDEFNTHYETGLALLSEKTNCNEKVKLPDHSNDQYFSIGKEISQSDTESYLSALDCLTDHSVLQNKSEVVHLSCEIPLIQSESQITSMTELPTVSRLQQTSLEESESSKESSEGITLNSKIFPLFLKGCVPKGKSGSPTKQKARSRRLLPSHDKDGKEQLLLDAGQKKMGTEICSGCGFLYDPDSRQDIEAHLSFHDRHKHQIRHIGWRNERVVANFDASGRVLAIRFGDPANWWKRVSEILETVNYDLGFIEDTPIKQTDSQVYLYIWNKCVVGCLVAEYISKAYRMLPCEEALCSKESFPASCGIVRIWTSATYRHKGVATRLMNVLRQNFFVGRNLELSEIAFSSPSSSGRAFAEKYFNTTTFFVY